MLVYSIHDTDFFLFHQVVVLVAADICLALSHVVVLLLLSVIIHYVNFIQRLIIVMCVWGRSDLLFYS